MASSIHALASKPYDPHLRPIDSYRDLGAVADVIEVCFRDTLDTDGQNYLRRLRDAARFSYLTSWATALVEDESVLPLSGYVWVEDERVVGNLSLIPFNSMGKRCYLIANVAVLPAYRGKGIGSLLTNRALDHVQEHHGASAWLQVRDDNPSAIHIYETQGFIERARRTTWVSAPSIQPLPSIGFEQGTSSIPSLSAKGYEVGTRLASHWALQRTWLQRMYPAEFSWHLPVNWKVIRPGWKSDLYRLFSLNYPKHWAVTRHGVLEGVLTWMSAPGTSDYLLLAAPEQADPEAVQALLMQARKSLRPRRHVTLNTPAEFVPEAIRASGFNAQQTLIWMQVDFKSTG